jgi:hypothetical protein
VEGTVTAKPDRRLTGKVKTGYRANHCACGAYKGFYEEKCPGCKNIERGGQFDPVRGAFEWIIQQSQGEIS